MQITLNPYDVVQRFTALEQTQLAYATANALNDTVLAFQDRERDQMRGSFTIRRPWTLQGVKINRGDFATKYQLRAIVHLDQGRDFFAKFETGETKTATDGGSLAIPKDARKTKAGIISKGQRPKAFHLRYQGTGPKATVFRGDKRTFLIKKPDGTGLLLQRTGKGKGSSLRTLFVLRKQARTPRTLHWVDNAQTTAARVFPHAFNIRLAEAVATARPR